MMATTKKGWLKQDGQPTQFGLILAVMLALLAPALVIGPVLVVLEVSGYSRWERAQIAKQAEERRQAQEAYDATPEGQAKLAQAVKAKEQAEEKAAEQAKKAEEFWETWGFEIKLLVLCLGIGLLMGTGDRSMIGGCAGILLIIGSLIWLGL